MKKILYPILIAIFFLLPDSKASDFSKADSIALSIPDNHTSSVKAISGFIGQTLSSDTEKIRALFTWITHNIDYETQLLTQTISYNDIDELSIQTLNKKSGICMHYAQLFSDVTNEMGIKSYVINGYTKQDKKTIDKTGHSWVAAYVNSEWRLYDPTWGAGYLSNNRFFRKVNYDYFQINPDLLIQTHMPFDPIWQFKYNPVTHKEFMDNIINDTKKPCFNYPDSLISMEELDDLEKLIASNRRIVQNGLSNTLVKEVYHNNRQNINIHLFNSAVGDYNQGTELLNTFIYYRNNQFKPEKEESEIRLSIDSIDIYLNKAKNNLRQIKQPVNELNKNMLSLYEQIEDIEKNVREQTEFINKYFSTKKPFRKTLFYKYTWMGMPLN